MSDAPNMPVNLSEIKNEGTVIFHDIGDLFGKVSGPIGNEVRKTVDITVTDLHARLLKVETFLMKLEERLRILRFW